MLKLIVILRRSGLKTLTSLMELLLSSVKNMVYMVFVERDLGSYCLSVIQLKLNLAERLRSLTIPSSWKGMFNTSCRNGSESTRAG